MEVDRRKFWPASGNPMKTCTLPTCSNCTTVHARNHHENKKMNIFLFWNIPPGGDPLNFFYSKFKVWTIYSPFFKKFRVCTLWCTRVHKPTSQFTEPKFNLLNRNNGLSLGSLRAVSNSSQARRKESESKYPTSEIQLLIPMAFETAGIWILCFIPRFLDHTG